MTERLKRIHALLRAGHVPCELSSRPGLGVVLQAGTPDTGMWDVVLRDTGTELWVHDAGGARQLPYHSPDVAVGDTVKLLLVQAWADQGNADAKALVAQLQQTSWPQSGSYRPASQAQHYDSSDFASQFFDPLVVAERMFEVAGRLGAMLLTPPRGSTAFTVWSPWGTVQIGYTRR
jgi:hypothetical protein